MIQLFFLSLGMKNELQESVGKFLEEEHFTLENGEYIFSTEIQTAGSVMIVNGTRMEQPGPKVSIKLAVTPFGEGSIGNDLVEGFMFSLSQSKEGDTDMQTSESLIYASDLDYFKSEFFSFFR